MSSDATQSALRLTLLASAIAAFMVVWAGDSAQTVGLTLAERNQSIVPAHAVDRRIQATSLARRPAAVKPPAVAALKPSSAKQSVRASLRPSQVEVENFRELPAGSYRVIFADGRAEWLTVVDKNAAEVTAAPAIVTTTINGETAHLIRVTARPAMDAVVR